MGQGIYIIPSQCGWWMCAPHLLGRCCPCKFSHWQTPLDKSMLPGHSNITHYIVVWQQEQILSNLHSLQQSTLCIFNRIKYLLIREQWLDWASQVLYHPSFHPMFLAFTANYSVLQKDFLPCLSVWNNASITLLSQACAHFFFFFFFFFCEVPFCYF